MALLVEYGCPECGTRTDRWVSRPLPETADCGRCAGTARRRFGGALLTRSPAPSAGSPSSGDGRTPAGGCGHGAGVPGTCTLTPTAARMLSARVRGDNRALDREIAHQESAIKAGTLDPAAPVTTQYSGGPLATQ
ncbi:hypothetical protein EV383_1037 [Pseudonocardia sediminis]|uniref:Uncharacterized protein n=1 Tax=Pseudonocardia sediminis TaxID=1397368 RepID=A0A4V2FQC3_PSEST|nr:zinc ribbon domain-containing protein [Pseudonocardia sediminis]RZT84200.1 hypothetical protein EV383_1037 [Pseudonocardia sediminis]